MEVILKIDSKTDRGKALLQFLKTLEENGDIVIFTEERQNQSESETEDKVQELSIPTYSSNGMKASFNRNDLYGIRL